MSLATNIRYLRKQKGWSQEDLANKLGYKSFTTIQKWESGVADPTFKKLIELADLLSVDIDDLASDNLEYQQTTYNRLKAYHKELIDKILRLDDIDRAKIEERIDIMLEGEKYVDRKKQG